MSAPNLYYAITNPSTGQEVWPKRDSVWACTKEHHEQYEREGRVWWGKDGTATVPAYRRFLSEVRDWAVASVWEWQDCGHNDQAKKKLKHLFPEGQRLETPKPMKLMRCIQWIAPTPLSTGVVIPQNIRRSLPCPTHEVSLRVES